MYLSGCVLILSSLISLQLSTAADDSGGYVEVLETFTCLAPILDMSVVDLDKQGRDVVGGERETEREKGRKRGEEEKGGGKERLKERGGD